MLEASLLGVETVLRLERGCAVNGHTTEATTKCTPPSRRINEYPPCPRPLPYRASPFMRLVEDLTALCAWCTRYLPDRGKRNVLRPDNAGMRDYIVIRLPPRIKREHLPPYRASQKTLRAKSIPLLWHGSDVSSHIEGVG